LILVKENQKGEVMQTIKSYNSKLNIFLDKLENNFYKLAEKIL